MEEADLQIFSERFRTILRTFEGAGEEDGERGRVKMPANPPKGAKHMRSSNLKALAVLTLAGAVVVLFGQFAAAQGPGAKLVGTWEVQITQVDCTSGTPLGPTFPSLLTFAKGGTMAEDTSNPAFGHGQRSAGQGTWRSASSSSYAAESISLIRYTTQPNAKTHNPGFEAGQQTITQDITYDAGSDQWSSTATVVFSDVNAKVYRQGCAAAKAQRF
jgi:hypothetical protein